ncbi:MAG: DNA polymerase IV [Candidatus Doudnabacteria bacterium]|nr:DNA polymerase IV [Candidatus Doudnabacteria bacterium]
MSFGLDQHTNTSGSRQILHVDMNSYFATLEQQANPRLRGVPIAIGGKGHGGVVVTASVEAKQLGVKVPSPSHRLLAEFPQVKIVPPTFAMYSHVTKQLIEIYQEFSPNVEVFSADEAFIDITDTASRFGGVTQLALRLKHRIQEEVGEWVTCSIGVAPNKVLAKLASDMKKPDGLTLITPERAVSVIRSVRLTDVCGIGPRISKRLHRLGIRTFSQLQEIPPDVLVRSFGSHAARWLKGVAFGQGSDQVVSFHTMKDEKSMGHQRTIQPTSNRAALLATFLHLSEKVGRRLRRKQTRGRTISIRIRYQSFHSEGRRVTLSRPLSDGYAIYGQVKELFQPVFLLDRVRLVGVTVSNLEWGAEQQQLFMKDAHRMESALAACDLLNDRYGEMVVRRGSLMQIQKKQDIPGLGFQKRFITDASSEELDA